MRFPKPPTTPEQLARKELRSRISNAFRTLRRMGLTATMTHRDSRSYKRSDLSTRVDEDGSQAFVDFIMASKDADNKAIHKVPAPFLHGVIRATLEAAGLKVKWDGKSYHAMKVSIPAVAQSVAA